MGPKKANVASTVRRLLDGLRPLGAKQMPFWPGQAFAVAVALIAIAVRVAFDPYVSGVPFITLFLAVVIAVYWAGPAAAATVVAITAGFASWKWLFLSPTGSETASSLVRLVLFIALSGMIVLIIGAHQRSYREKVSSERRAEVLAEEMRHRVANLLQIVQTLIRRTAPNAETPAELRISLTRMIDAMSRAQSVSAQCPEQGTDLRSLLTTLLEPFPVVRITLSGPDTLIPAEAVTPVGLVVFELATNAAKYGSLSNESGSVSVSWIVDPREVVIAWTERGGPTVSIGERKGFGSVLLTTAVPPAVGGVEVAYPEIGVEARVRLAAKDQRS